MVYNIVFKLPKHQDQQHPIIHIKSEFIIRISIRRAISTYSIIAPHPLGGLKLTLRCAIITIT
jgi:hypothetical protein